MTRIKNEHTRESGTPTRGASSPMPRADGCVCVFVPSTRAGPDSRAEPRTTSTHRIAILAFVVVVVVVVVASSLRTHPVVVLSAVSAAHRVVGSSVLSRLVLSVSRVTRKQKRTRVDAASCCVRTTCASFVRSFVAKQGNVIVEPVSVARRRVPRRRIDASTIALTRRCRPERDTSDGKRNETG